MRRRGRRFRGIVRHVVPVILAATPVAPYIGAPVEPEPVSTTCVPGSVGSDGQPVRCPSEPPNDGCVPGSLIPGSDNRAYTVNDCLGLTP